MLLDTGNFKLSHNTYTFMMSSEEGKHCLNHFIKSLIILHVNCSQTNYVLHK